MEEQRQKVLRIVTHSADETVALGRSLARDLAPPCLVLLEGELGAGKTTLIKGIVAGLGAAGEDDVSSPSYTLVHEYGGPECTVYHADLYRVEGAQELATLGLEELVDREATVIVEWGGKLEISRLTPDVRIELDYAGEDERRVKVEWLTPTPQIERERKTHDTSG